MTSWFRQFLAATVLCTLTYGAAAEATTEPVAWKLPPVRVVSPSGEPVAKAAVAMVRVSKPLVGYRAIETDSSGSAVFTSKQYLWPNVEKAPPGNYEVLALAQGMAPTIVPWTVPTDEPLSIQVKPGKSVKVSLKGPRGAAVPPDLVPFFYPKNYGSAMWPERRGETNLQLHWAKSLGDGQFEVSLAADTTEPLQMLIHHPGYLRGFEKTIETTAALAKGSIEVELPTPGAAKLRLEVPESLKPSAGGKEFYFHIATLLNLGDDQIYMPVADATMHPGSTQLEAHFDNIPPGEYWLSVNEATKTTGTERFKIALFSEGEGVEIKSGETTTVVVQYKELDRSKFQGKHTAQVTVKQRDGSPAAKHDFELRTIDREFGWVIITTGTLDDKGSTAIERLAGGSKDSPLFRLYEGGDWGGKIGNIRFDTPETPRSFTFTLPPKPGEPAPDVSFTDVYTSETVKLSDFRGKVVVLDFWATWCDPCQGPMEKNQKLLTKNAATWGDKVVIIGASVDDDTESVRKHVKEKSWDKVRHLWCGGTFRDNIPSQTYGVDGVPTIFLIDQEGKLVEQTGDLESQVNQLLSGT